MTSLKSLSEEPLLEWVGVCTSPAAGSMGVCMWWVMRVMDELKGDESMPVEVQTPFTQSLLQQVDDSYLGPAPMSETSGLKFPRLNGSIPYWERARCV